MITVMLSTSLQCASAYVLYALMHERERERERERFNMGAKRRKMNSYELICLNNLACLGVLKHINPYGLSNAKPLYIYIYI